MSTTKKCLILVILILLFVSLLVAGALLESSGRATPDTSKLGKLLEPVADAFVPSIPLSNVRCNNQRVTSQFSLSEAQSSCRMRLKPGSDDDYAKTKISVTGSNANLYFVARLEEKEFPKNKRDKRRYFIDQSTLQEPYILAYWDPTDGDDPKKPNWLAYILTDSPGELTTLDKGGHLTLECIGCTGNNNPTIRMQ